MGDLHHVYTGLRRRHLRLAGAGPRRHLDTDRRLASRAPQYPGIIAELLQPAREIRLGGIENTIASAAEIAGRGTDAIYVTVDIDVLEVGYAPGTAAATADGLSPADLFEALFILGQDPKVAAIDFVELDPTRDVAEITTRTLGSAILTFLAGLFLRQHNGWRGYDPKPIRS